MPPEAGVKVAVYEHFAAAGRRPSVDEIAARTGMAAGEVREILIPSEVAAILVRTPANLRR